MADRGPSDALPLVVKIGGSLAETGRLKGVLGRVVDAGRPVVIVPGGGSFADKVRNLQHAMRFDDKAAHRLAMLGMHQMAEVFVALEPRLAIADSFEQIDRHATEGRVSVWVPLPMMESDKGVPQDWSTTSDSIAARFAERLGGAQLAILKSVDVGRKDSAETLSARGVVDGAFPAIVRRADLDWRVFGPSDDADLADALSGPDRGLGKS